MRAVTAYGRWLWGVSGLVTAAALFYPGARFFMRAADSPTGQAIPMSSFMKTMFVGQPVTSVSVSTCGAPAEVESGPVRQVEVTEQVTYVGPRAQAQLVWPVVSGGQLVLSDSNCSLGDITVVVPQGMDTSVSSQGGPIKVSGTATTTLDSGGGQITVNQVDGALNVHAEGGPVSVNDLTGTLHIDTGGGPLNATNIDAQTVVADGEGGNLTLAFAVPPQALLADTGGGNATILVPGGPYSVSMDTGGGPLSLRIATNPAAKKSITVNTEGGQISIAPAAAQPAK
jgi:hypothetical protein